MTDISADVVPMTTSGSACIGVGDSLNAVNFDGILRSIAACMLGGELAVAAGDGAAHFGNAIRVVAGRAIELGNGVVTTAHDFARTDQANALRLQGH